MTKPSVMYNNITEDEGGNSRNWSNRNQAVYMTSGRSNVNNSHVTDMHYFTASSGVKLNNVSFISKVISENAKKRISEKKELLSSKKS